jgi:hypothetical protein
MKLPLNAYVNPLLKLRLIGCALLVQFLLNSSCAFKAYGDSLEPSSSLLRTRPQPALQLKREASLDLMLPRVDYPVKVLQPIPLNGIRIPGLGSKAIQLLGFNYFVVVNNTDYTNMAQLYKDNRLRGKSNFVTVDSVIHPYFAFTNRVLADMIQRHLQPDLATFLQALLDVSLADYKIAEDAEVRSDIEHNLAFLSVALKLLEPKFITPSVGNVASLVDKDLKAIMSGDRSNSAIFEHKEDFSCYQPMGWYNSTPALQNFYRCREWITRMGFPVSETSSSPDRSSGNSFRRSVLLQRALEISSIKSKPAYDTWLKIQRAWPLLGAPVAAWQDSTLLPSEYKSIFKNLTDLKVTLNSLSEPFYRTKLLLSVRKQKPMGLGTTSIFDLEDSKHSSDLTAIYRLFPVTGDPEMSWMHSAAAVYPEGIEGNPIWPLALLDLHAWGAGQANNILNDNSYLLDPALSRALPELDKSIQRRGPNGQLKAVEDRRWTILSTYFKPLPDGAQGALKTDMWLTRRLESAFAGWLDSHLSIAPEEDLAGPTTTQIAASQTSQPTASSELEPGKQVKPAYYHYLEPAPDTYRKIREDAQKLIQDLTALGYFNERSRERFMDFTRLCLRLEKIAEMELMGQSIPFPDLKLLGNIDLVLDKVVVPLAGVMAISPPTSHEGGVNLALGRPGQIYVILQPGLKTILARGAQYTYYEMPGTPMGALHWQRKLDFAMLKVPFWTDKFDLVQSAPPSGKR